MRSSVAASIARGAFMNNPNATRSAATDWLGAATIGIALIVSAIVAAGLVSADLSEARKLRLTRQAVSESPAYGTLSGQVAYGNREWNPGGAEKPQVLLFAVAPDGEIGDAQFWTDVALKSRVATPDIQFVGLCSSGGKCTVPTAVAETFTLLSAMDPLQMRALAIASSQGRALVYGASGGQRLLPVQGDRRAMTIAISQTFSHRSRPEAT